MKTFSPKPKDLTRRWYLLDASQMPLGRLASTAAALLIGKGKPTFSPHFDGGDFVVVINAQTPVISGAKAKDKVYYRHSGFAGGLHSRRLEEQLSRDPTKVVYQAVRGMLPANKLRPERLKRLKIYSGGDHQHQAQNPTPFLKASKENS